LLRHTTNSKHFTESEYMPTASLPFVLHDLPISFLDLTILIILGEE
jgi:hypothetical protein